MTVFVHSISIISFKFLFVDSLGPTATLIRGKLATGLHLLVSKQELVGKFSKWSTHFYRIRKEGGSGWPSPSFI